VTPWLLLIAAYLLGAIPSSYIAGRAARGIDLREHGSGNLGASNTFRVLGARVAAPVMLFDVFKGWLPAWYFPSVDGAPAWEWALAYGAAAVIGHVLPVYMRFRGGKGVATAAGVFLAVSPPAAIGVAIGAWVLVLAATRIVSLASISAAVAMVVMLSVLETRAPVLWLGVAVASFVVFAHRSNIRRLVRGEELQFRRGASLAEPGEPVRREEEADAG
jgi:acyl phosphate:glycerol-3-phosphate acyltransferase